MAPLRERSDGELAEAIAAGDENAFLQVYDAHGAVLFGVVARLLRDRDAAADVVQEVFVTVWLRASRYEPALGSLRTWLVSIARNRALDRLRMDARRPRVEPLVDRTTEDGRTNWSRSELATATIDDSPASSLERRWVQAVVRSAMAGMPDDERTVLVLAYDEGLSQSKIAIRLGTPVGTVKSRTRRGMARLREMLSSIPDVAEPGPREVPGGTR